MTDASKRRLRNETITRSSANCANGRKVTMAKTALAFSIMPDSPIRTIVEWTRRRRMRERRRFHDRGEQRFARILACAWFQHTQNPTGHLDHASLPPPSEPALQLT